jgi:Arc/MetJ-type ribon-helix-helix transcriptional regulator
MADEHPDHGPSEAEEIRDYYSQTIYERQEIGQDASNLNTTVQVRVNKQIKQLWEERVAASDYTSVSDLIRVAVGKELSGRYSQQEHRTSEILEMVSETHTKLETLQTQVESVHGDLFSEDDMQEMMEVMKALNEGEEDG